MMADCARCHGTQPDSTDPTPDDDTLAAGPINGITCVACHNPHPEEASPYPAMLTNDTYALCVSCHNSATPEGDEYDVGGKIHHPVQEMFEGQQIVNVIEGIPSGHFAEENGPRCVDCHMPDTVSLGEFARAGSHTMNTVLGGDPTSGQPDSCVVCHTDLSPDYIRRFVDETQTGVAERVAVLTKALESAPDAPDWVQTILNFVEGDGSFGVHNFPYTDALLNAAEVELGIVQLNPIASPALVQTRDPETCAECHREEFQRWQVSPHANASLGDTFLEDFANQGRPSYCMSCHASGYNPNTGEHAFEGVVCSNCHIITNDSEHPPAPVEIANAASDCGRCHSGAHAPTYDEWLVSSHKTAGIDCVDCHTPHDNGLLLGDVNATCGDCHKEAVVDEIHMGEGMTCVDCHLNRQVKVNGIEVRTTGHTMSIDPGTCAECHGNTHLLSVRELNNPEDLGKIQELEGEITDLKDEADANWNSGIVGGALGALIVVFVLYLMIRLRSLL
jgi:predicted CXXCH cytochrome family protein